MNRNYIASELLTAAKEITADYGDATYFLNASDIFLIPHGSDSATGRLMTDMLEDALIDSSSGINKMVVAKLKRDRRMNQLEEAGIGLR